MSDIPVNPFDDAEEIAKKSMVLFFLIDCSGSMGGSKIGTVNSVMEELIPEIQGIGGADADIKIAVLKFSGGSEWMYSEPISVDQFEWKPLDAENVTDLGSAFSELSGKLSRNSFMSSPSLSFAPVMILMSDGYPTDNFEKGLEELRKNRWYTAGIKAAVAIGEDADFDILARFTGNPDSVVTAHNGEALAKLVKFVAVTSSQIGSRSMRLAETEEDFQKALDDLYAQAESMGMSKLNEWMEQKLDEALAKQETAAEQIREFAESDEINADIEEGW